jgi:hypothetical protein
MVPPDRAYNEKTERMIGTQIVSARRLLAETGSNVIDLYRSSEYKELARYSLSFAAFRAYRANLPRYRRVFLLYKTPNPHARMPHMLFHLYLIFIAIDIAAMFLTQKTHEIFLERAHLQGPVDFTDAIQTLWNVLFLLTILACTLILRYIFQTRENDRSCYIRDRIYRRFHGDIELPKENN